MVPEWEAPCIPDQTSVFCKTTLPMGGHRSRDGRRAMIQHLPPDEPFNGQSTQQNSVPPFPHTEALPSYLCNEEARSAWEACFHSPVFPFLLRSPAWLASLSDVGKLPGLSRQAHRRGGKNDFVFDCFYEWAVIKVEGRKVGGGKEGEQTEGGPEEGGRAHRGG